MSEDNNDIAFSPPSGEAPTPAPPAAPWSAERVRQADEAAVEVEVETVSISGPAAAAPADSQAPEWSPVAGMDSGSVPPPPPPPPPPSWGPSDSQMPPVPAFQPNAAPGYGQPGSPYAQGMPAQEQAGPYPGAVPPAPPPVARPVLIRPVPDVSISTGFNYAWAKFRANLTPLFLVALSYVGAALLLALIFVSVTSQVRSGWALTLLTLLLTVAVVVFAAFAQANLVRGTLKILRGELVEYTDFFKFDDVGKVVALGLIIGLGSALLSFTFVAPVIISALTTFAMWLIIDRQYGVWDSIVASASIVWNNVATVVLYFIGAAVASWVGALFFGFGILFAIPVILIAQGWLYRTLISEPVAP